jgi:hypothetical protein
MVWIGGYPAGGYTTQYTTLPVREKNSFPMTCRREKQMSESTEEIDDKSSTAPQRKCQISEAEI